MVTTEDTKRMFTVEGSGTFLIATPTADDIRSSDWQYSKIYNKALIEGVTTAGEMYDILKRRGIIGEAYEKRVQELKDQIGQKIVEMELSSDKEARRVMALEISAQREELFRWNQRCNGPLSNTCEQISEDARLEYLTSCIIQKSDGTRVWKDYDSYTTEPNRALCWQARFEVMLFLQGLEPDFLEKTPENVVLKELAKEEADRQKSQEEAVAIPEEPATVEEPAKVKKGGRKPKKESAQ